MTKAPLSPPVEVNTRSSFRTAMTEYLPTPPASISSEHSSENVANTGSPIHGKDDISIAVRYASPSYGGLCQSQPSFRRRYGRGGRLMIDRRGMPMQSKEGLNDIVADRFKYDRDDDDDEIPVYTIDTSDISSLQYRARISALYQSQSQGLVSRRPQPESMSRSSQGSILIPDSATLHSQPKPD